MPRPRFNVRQLMIAVAAVVVIVTWIVLAPGAEYCDVAVVKYAEYAGAYESPPGGVLPLSTCYGDGWDYYTFNVVEPDVQAHAADPAHRRVRAEYYRKLQRKYRDAARYPWLPVAPDPPEPE